MPDFGLTEALANALKATKEAKFTRAPEAAAAAREASLAPTPGGPKPGLEPVNPADPAPAVPANAPVPPVAAEPASGTPPLPGDGAPPLPPDATVNPPVTDQTGPPPGVRPSDPAVPSAVADDLKPGQSPVEAAGAPRRPGTTDGLPPPKSPLEAAARTNAERYVTANMSDFKGKLDMTHMPNVDTIQAPERLKASLLQLADDNKGAIDEARRGEIKDEQLVAMAQDLATNTDILGTVLNRELGDQFKRPEVVLAARMVGVNTLGESVVASDPIRKGTATSADVLNYARTKQTTLDYITQLQGALAEQGRGLRAARLPTPGTLPQEVLDHIADIYRRNNPNLKAEADAVALAQTPVGIANILSGNLSARIGKAALSALTRIFTNGILSGPATWVKIFIGNSFNTAVNAGDFIAAGLIRGGIGLAARVGRFPTPTEGATLRDAFNMVHGTIMGAADGMRLANRVLRTGVSLDNVMRFDPTEISGVRNVNPSLGTTQSILPELQGTWFGAIAKHMDTVIDAPGSRVIGSIDEFAKTMGARGYRTTMVMKEIEARWKDGSLKPGDEGIIAKQMFENPSPEMLQAEEAYAHRMSFQTPWPEGGAGEKFSQWVNNHVPALKFIFPFMRTATNIFKQSVVERTPLGFFSARVRAQLASGGMERDLAMGRIATGTAIGSMVAWFAIHDNITGDAPKDPKERALWELDGRTPYSVKVTNPVTGVTSWHSYAQLEPMASIMGIVADSANAWTRIHQYADDETMLEKGELHARMIGNIMAAIITNTMNKTFMTGALKFSEMVHDPAKGLANWATDMGVSLVPYSKAIEFVRNVSDPYMRDAWNLHDKIMNDIPGESSQLGVARDLFGNKRTGAGILGNMSPFPSHPIGADSVTDELNALMNKTQEVPLDMPQRHATLPHSGSGKGVLGGDAGMQLTSREYDELVYKSRAAKVFDDGTLNLHDKLAQVMQSPTYLESKPAERVALLAPYVKQADHAGRQALFNDNQAFADRLVAWTQRRDAIKYKQ